MRILIAEDSVLLRAGITRLLVDAGMDVIASVGDATGLVEAVERHLPDLAVVDVRMPPTNTDDGLRARSCATTSGSRAVPPSATRRTAAMKSPTSATRSLSR